MKWQWPYSGFGEIAPQSTPAAGQAPVNYSLRYPGQIDDGNGLFYNWHRFYDPRVGRYTKADPIGLEGGWNRFAYVGGNPLGFVDPEGLQAQAAAVACGPYYVLCVCAISAVTWGVYSSSSDDMSMHDGANRRQRQYEAAKSRSCIPNPDPDNLNCSEISKTIDTLQNAIDRYEYFDAQYTPGRHAPKIEQLKERISKLKERYNSKCTQCK